ncbi:MAG: YicC/YloC family endoribonuclease [Acidiferrobacteraceae bacterium]
MTGFARCSRTFGLGMLTCEIRSVNHRYLEVALRLPDAMRPLEGPLRERLALDLKRGKVECSVRLEGGTEPQDLAVNEQVVDSLCRLGAELERRHGVAPLRVIDVLRWPNVLAPGVADTTALAPATEALVAESLRDLMVHRAREGAKLMAVLESRLADIRAEVTRVREIVPELVPEFRARLRARLEDLTASLDVTRLEQEITLFAQRSDVSEELDRLWAHLQEVERLLQAPGPVGRQLDFMMQELNREANTLGSKSTDLRLTAASVEIKVLIEQMREQIQNIE